MGWDGSGNVVRTNGTNTGTTVWQDDKSADIRIRADLHDTHDQDLADSIERCLNLDGENTMNADLNMGGFKLSNAGEATSGDDFPTYSQAQRQEMSVATASGTDALSASFSPAIANLDDKLTLYVRAAAQNTSTTPTFSPNGLSAKTIVKEGNEPLLVGDIAGQYHVLILQYHLSNDAWELMNPATMSVFFPNVDGAVTPTKEEMNVLDGITATTEQLNSSGVINNFSATRIPTVNDDSDDGYEVGSRWVDTTTGSTWACVDATVGAAVWEYDSAYGVAKARADAPKIEYDALDLNKEILQSDMAENSIGQPEMRDASIGRLELRTTTGSISGSTANFAEISMNGYAFFPSIFVDRLGPNLDPSLTDSGPDTPRFRLANPGGTSETFNYDVDYRYITS